MKIKKMILRIFFTLELCVFAGIYIFGPQGLRALHKIEYDNMQVLNRIQTIKPALDELEHTIAQWHTQPFFKEKIAREQLQMARSDEEIYYLVS